MRTELHFHALPGVDDGPRDDAEAIELAALAAADGTGRVVATPHVRNVDVAELPERVAELRARLADAGVQIDLRVGGELAADDVGRLSDDELDVLAHGPSGRRWVLLEAPLFPVEPSLPAAAAELRARGFAVVVAHPERSSFVSEPEIRAEAESGAWLQINASSLAGGHGAAARERAVQLARSGLAFVVASDAHSASRPPLLTEAAHTLAAAGLEPAAVRAAVDDVPEALLAHGLRANGRLRALREG